ncbi:riboflavin synthase [Paenibacillus sp. 481]|uniref:riboflavin synthase n=1 Tax=Paenibacillus sp. 481 TaxID=2835869 RepID=UPI001E47AE40|nr:riboflavin synthase [Paenibacillus sp. 481]UHA72920.1 riboflavin synthase [Paenibacillus sp. 481]
MFTGLIEEIGVLRSISRRGEAMVLDIAAKKVLTDISIGDSIAVNGVCLTVTAFDRATFRADVMPETFRHTSLKQLSTGTAVNLERAMAANGRFGGHIVQGHVDGTATLIKRTPEANAVLFEFQTGQTELAKYMIPKGSITIDGISLTLVRAQQGHFAVSIIPHTLVQTALTHKQAGDIVNIECDVLGKYVDHLLRYGRSAAEAESAANSNMDNGDSFVTGASGSSGSSKSSSKGISAAFLAENGF